LTYCGTTVKLLHRDMGPISRYLGPDVPQQRFIWQDPLPTTTFPALSAADQASLKAQILAAPGVNISSLVSVAWGSASTFRGGDKRGGANGARIALQPQASWVVNNPPQLQIVLSAVRLSHSIPHAPPTVKLTSRFS
jgi:catalase-peroxidase